MSQTPGRTVVVLAAGEGKRMKSATPKVLHPLLGRTLLGHVLSAATSAAADHTIVVVGHKGDLVRAHLEEVAPGATTVLQAEQNGTGRGDREVDRRTAAGGGRAVRAHRAGAKGAGRGGRERAKVHEGRVLR